MAYKLRLFYTIFSSLLDTQRSSAHIQLKHALTDTRCSLRWWLESMMKIARSRNRLLSNH